MDGGESERWLGIAAKLLTTRDFIGSRTFAIRAKESDPNNPVSDQILAVVDTVLSGEKRVETTQQPDWYGVLQLPKLVRDGDLITDHYRRLVMLLSPDRNRLPFADYALQLVMEAWSVLSDPTKKWLFDNELASSLQNSAGSSRVDAVRVDPNSVSAAAGGSGSGSGGGGVGSGSGQVNTFEFFQPVPAPLSQQQQQTRSQPHLGANLQMWQQQQPVAPQIVQREFITAPAPQMPAQWQLRDLNPNPHPNINPNPNPNPNPNINPSTNPKVAVEPTPAPWVARSVWVPPAPAPAQVPVPPVVTAAQDGNGNVGGNDNSSKCNGVGGNNANVDGNKGNVEGGGGGGGEEEVESFWTACPYCFYIYEYQKEYQDCTLRCQNCRRAFHALPVPNAPPVGPASGGKEKGKGKASSFCCWGFFPLGLSMAAWKKHSRNELDNWVPFSPMFASPRGNGGRNFHWFTNDRNGTPMYGGRGAHGSAPRVYIDDDDEVFDVPDSDGDLSDRDWRNAGKRKNKGQVGGGKRRNRRPRKADRFNQEIRNSVGEGIVTGPRERMENGLVSREIVLGLVAGKTMDTNKTAASTVTRKQTRRSMKDRLDLNVEFNNEGDEHAPAVSAVNRDEDGIENIGFFEGLDEFLSTLPILNVGGDEKAKPS